ncbi:hypothetical protein J1N35_024967 [Gossypium stocksii]|uniref:Uncharacterized protein n=1 Tax=Gossypium stocksii TaxID=47602 RepID=A0A9D3V5I9_9ROSI|nr:hypothetical protein J1N35_024967 [Gossypium stocksii]
MIYQVKVEKSRSIMAIDSPLKRPKDEHGWRVSFNENNERMMVNDNGDDHLVTITTIANHEVKKILINSGIIVKVLH